MDSKWHGVEGTRKRCEFFGEKQALRIRKYRTPFILAVKNEKEIEETETQRRIAKAIREEEEEETCPQPSSGVECPKTLLRQIRPAGNDRHSWRATACSGKSYPSSSPRNGVPCRMFSPEPK